MTPHDADEPDWWAPLIQEYANPAFHDLLRREDQADQVKAFESILVPGLLQTKDYAGAVLGEHFDDRQVGRLLELRMERQRRIRLRGAVQEYLLSEGALHWTMGSAELHREQLERILEESERAEVTVRVIPFSVLYSGFDGPFHLFESERAGDFLFLERPPSDHARPGADPWVDNYKQKFAEFRDRALDADESRALIRQISGDPA